MAQADWITYGNAGGAKAAQIARLRELFANVGGDFSLSDRWNETGGEDSQGYYSPVAQNAQLAALLKQHGMQGGALTPQGTLDPRSVQVQRDVRGEYGEQIGDRWRTVGSDEFNPGSGWQSGPVQWGTPTGYQMTLDEMADPERAGKKGAYTLTFNPDGSIGDVAWQNYDLSKGFLGDNMSWLGPLAVGGLAALGAGMGGAAGSAAPIVESTPSWVAPGSLSTGTLAGGSAPSIGAAGAAAGAAGAAGAGGLGAWAPTIAGLAATPLIGAIVGTPSLPSTSSGPNPQAGLDDSIAKINALFGGRDSVYGQVRDDIYGLQANRLNDNREDTLRKLRFGLARTGMTGGSADVSAQGREQREFGRALMDASNTAQSAADEVRANDERTRLNLISQMRAGLDAGNATQNALSQMASNVNAARGATNYAAVDSYAAAMQPALARYQTQRGTEQARREYQPAYPLARSSSGTLIRGSF